MFRKERGRRYGGGEGECEDGTGCCSYVGWEGLEIKVRGVECKARLGEEESEE